MVLLGRMLCLLSSCLAPGARMRERSRNAAVGNGPGEGASDDLTAIRGIGITTRDRLLRAGIRSYADLTRASPERVQAILGKFGRGADVEHWIAQARDFVDQRTS